MNQPVITPPKKAFWDAVNKHLVPALQKQEKPTEKKQGA